MRVYGSGKRMSGERVRRVVGRRVMSGLLGILAIASCVGWTPDAAFAQTTPITYYLSEGATSLQFFNEDILIANPNNAAAPVTLTFSTESGQQVEATRLVPAQARITVRVNEIAGLEQASASARIRSDNGLALLVERTMFWNKTSYAGHTGSSVDQPSPNWFFAEGSQGTFDTFVLAINPNPSPVDITFTFLREGEPTVVKTLSLGASTRLTLHASDVPELVNRSFGIAVHATQPIMVERSMYWSTPTRTWSGGTESAGVKAASTHWFLAEGATGSYFDTFVLLSNPQSTAAHVELKYLLDTAATVTIPKTIPAGARLTTNIAAEPDARLRNASMSTVVTSDVPIIAERSMYWKGASTLWGEGHNSFGVIDAGGDWGLAEGRNGGPLNFHTYILLANPNTSAAEVKVRYLRENGSAVVKTYTVAPTSRFNIDTGGITELQHQAFGAVVHVTNSVSIVVERSMYWDVDGVQFSGGTNATGIPVSAAIGALDPVDAPGNFPNTYPGFTYTLPTTRPFISLQDYAGVDRSSRPYTRLRSAVDRTLAGNPFYGFSATHAVLMFKLTNDPKYIQLAINTVETHVTEAEADIASRGYPDLAGDSYLDVGWFIEQISLAYDYGYDRLTPQQRQRWAALADQAIYNVWNPNNASWGGVKRTWSGWSISDPGNNYHYSFLRATMMWALATQNGTWFDFLQAQKFPPLVTYFAALPGGGSREGTGYGTALGNLFGDYLFWKSSTGEDLANLTAHPRETIDYWVYATVPTRDRFAPIGDLSRESIPNIYDYHENLIHQAVVLSAGSPQARRGTWWLQNNSIDGVSSEFNLPGDLLPYPDAAVQPTDLVYHSTGTGAFFARTSWATNATWFAMVAGKYDQSHAHHDQGSFTFFKGDWLAVTANIWSHSGIHQEDEVHNVIRFERTSNGSVIPQNTSNSVQSSLSYAQSGDLGNGGTLSVTANLANAYSQNRSAILAWTRNLELTGTTLRVHDVCSVAASVKPVFQLHVPVQPVLQGDGSIVAGTLRLVPRLPVQSTFTKMPSPEYSKGWRIDLTIASGCEFDVELRAQ